MANDYQSVFKNTGTTPRTYDEAYNTADYATALWKCDTENKRGVKLLLSLAMVAGGVAWVGLSLYAIYKLFVS